MTEWHFWWSGKFIYDNIYQRSHRDDWFFIINAITSRINSQTSENKRLLDIGCGEGHTTKQILDRIQGDYSCDILEPDVPTLAIAESYLRMENHIGKTYWMPLSQFEGQSKWYDIIFTSHTNYYWWMTEEEFDSQLQKLMSLLNDGGQLLILALPEHSAHYDIMLRQIYPAHNYAEYIMAYYNRLGYTVELEKFQMRLYIADLLSNQKLFDLTCFYKFIHNTDIPPNPDELATFRWNIINRQYEGYLDFQDYLLVVKQYC